MEEAVSPKHSVGIQDQLGAGHVHLHRECNTSEIRYLNSVMIRTQVRMPKKKQAFLGSMQT